MAPMPSPMLVCEYEIGTAIFLILIVALAYMSTKWWPPVTDPGFQKGEVHLCETVKITDFAPGFCHAFLLGANEAGAPPPLSARSGGKWKLDLPNAL